MVGGGGSHKYGRGGGRGSGGGGAKRNSFPQPPPRHPTSTASGRLSLGGAASSRRNAPPPPSSSSETEESFSLVGGNPLSFAAIIRLAPDLVEEIKRVEEGGGAARIKFDPNPTNPLGNVIDVGGKEFRFTWSHETGGLCDIYEERQSGEDGNGLLVESGCAWRKLNVQRVLDESTKNHVKMRSEEAERKHKSRKAIILDQCNPTTKSQMKALAAAEASPWKFKHKKDMQFKKKNFEPSQVGGPPKHVHKSGFPSTNMAKGRRSTSPLPSPQNQPVSLASPSTRRNATETQAIGEDAPPFQPRIKESAVVSEKDVTAQTSSRMQEAATCRESQTAGAIDVQTSLITLLKESPKGMSIKALAKSIGDATPSSALKLEPILKKIATCESGRYILKPGVEIEGLTCFSSVTGSSPEDNHQKQYVPEDNHGPALDSGFAGTAYPEGLEEQVPLNNTFEEAPNLVENVDTSQHLSELFGDDEVPDNCDKAASSSDSGSDSDSDSGSSDSGSDSGSRSRSRSPVGTASGSGSDNENDSASNSKEGSDIDIDIVDDDDKELKQPQDTENGLSLTNVPWNMPEARPVQDGSVGDQDGYASEDIDIDIDIEKEFLDDNGAELATAPHDHAMSMKELKDVSPDRDQIQSYGVTNVLNEQNDEFKHERPERSGKSNGKSKRGSDVVQLEENAENVKRLKAGSYPDITNEDHNDNHGRQMPNQFNRDGNSNLGMQGGYNYPVTERSAAEVLQSGRRPPPRSHGVETADKFVKNPQDWKQNLKYQELNAHTCETQDEEGNLHEKVNGKFKVVSDQKQLVRPEPHLKKHSEEGKMSHLMDNSSKMNMRPSPKISTKADSNRSPDRRRLRRELSDLELGELREPVPEFAEVNKKQFERVESFKKSEARIGTSGSQNADLKGKPFNKLNIAPGNTSSPDSRAGVPKNSDDRSNNRRSSDGYEDTIRPPQMAVQSQQQQSRFAQAEVGSLSNKATDPNRLRHNEGVRNQGSDVEGYGETQKKSSTSTQVGDSRQDLGSRKVKGNKSRKSNTTVDASDRRRDVSVIGGGNDKRKRSESSSDDNSSYTKYEKEEPELKGPIQSFAQYKEYVQEYREKYESYSSLNKILEGYRNEFQKLGVDLDSAKGRDTERYVGIVAQLRESYRQCGPRHKRLKKIFIVLHEELKHLKQRIKDFALDYTRV